MQNLAVLPQKKKKIKGSERKRIGKIGVRIFAKTILCICETSLVLTKNESSHFLLLWALVFVTTQETSVVQRIVLARDLMRERFQMLLRMRGESILPIPALPSSQGKKKNLKRKITGRQRRRRSKTRGKHSSSRERFELNMIAFWSAFHFCYSLKRILCKARRDMNQSPTHFKCQKYNWQHRLEACLH